MWPEMTYLFDSEPTSLNIAGQKFTECMKSFFVMLDTSI